jgi:hypothetical protein
MLHGVRPLVAVLGAWLATAVPAGAGVYISFENHPNEFRLMPIKRLRSTLQVLALPDRPNDPDREPYVRHLAVLEAKEKAGGLTDIDRADLGGIYLRFGRPRDAARVLSAGGGGNFLVLCNLAVANHELAVQELDVNRLEEAVLTERRALAAWPALWGSWSNEQWYSYRRVERLEQRLLDLRFREMRAADGKQPLLQTVDDLFPGFKMVGPTGEYEAGRVAFAAFDALPPDAPWLVRELMMAYPTDPRLYWLFGELLNACGRVEDALQVLDNLVNVNQLSNVRELVAHRRLLLERASMVRDLRATPMFASEPQGGCSAELYEDLYWALAPPISLGIPVAGAAASQGGWWATAAAVGELQREERFGRPPPPPELPRPSVPAAASEASTALPDGRVLLVGFGAGVVVTALVALQWGVWKRRRQASASRRLPVG